MVILKYDITIDSHDRSLTSHRMNSIEEPWFSWSVLISPRISLGKRIREIQYPCKTSSCCLMISTIIHRSQNQPSPTNHCSCSISLHWMWLMPHEWLLITCLPLSQILLSDYINQQKHFPQCVLPSIQRHRLVHFKAMLMEQ